MLLSPFLPHLNALCLAEIAVTTVAAHASSPTSREAESQPDDAPRSFPPRASARPRGYCLSGR